MMTVGPAGQCWFCQHLHEESEEQMTGEREDFTCDAYPHGIPPEIFHGEVDHTKPYDGDNGIQFEEAEGVTR